MREKDRALAQERISPERMRELEDFCAGLDLHFKDLGLLDLALHHRSFSNENEEFRTCNNERLEFLGDSVLGLSTAAFLYNDMRDCKEGELSRIKSNVVSEQVLAPIALDKMRLDRFLVLGRGEELSGGRKKPAILADAVEAVLGALYLDSGYEAAERLVERLIVPEIRKVQADRGNRDWKSLLQEFYQKKARECPRYELVSASGPDHDRIFEVKVFLGGRSFGPAKGKNKKSAEQEAARMACLALGVEER